MTRTTVKYGGPYPTYVAKVSAECRGVLAALLSVHGPVKRKRSATDPAYRRADGPSDESSALKEKTYPKYDHLLPNIKPEPASSIVKTENAVIVKDEPGTVGIVSIKQETEPETSVQVKSEAAVDATAASITQSQSCPPCGCDTASWSVLDSLIRTILSQNTTDITSMRAFKSLKEAFPTWEQVRVGDVKALAESIRVGGLADIKAARIQAILNTLHEERGVCCLEHLRDLPDDEVKQQLCRFKGVGPKTVACVLMFCMERAEFPVDTHVLHICRKLGWVPDKAGREDTYEHLNACLPDDVKYDLHVLLVQHGKVCCKLRPDGKVAPSTTISPSKKKNLDPDQTLDQDTSNNLDNGDDAETGPASKKQKLDDSSHKSVTAADASNQAGSTGPVKGVGEPGYVCPLIPFYQRAKYKYTDKTAAVDVEMTEGTVKGKGKTGAGKKAAKGRAKQPNIGADKAGAGKAAGKPGKVHTPGNAKSSAARGERQDEIADVHMGIKAEVKLEDGSAMDQLPRTIKIENGSAAPASKLGECVTDFDQDYTDDVPADAAVTISIKQEQKGDGNVGLVRDLDGNAPAVKAELKQLAVMEAENDDVIWPEGKQCRTRAEKAALATILEQRVAKRRRA